MHGQSHRRGRTLPSAFNHGKHVINVTVEADAFCGPLLAHKAKSAGVTYSLAYGDQPALACDLVDWARKCAAIANATGWTGSRAHLPPGSVDDIPTLMRPKSEGSSTVRGRSRSSPA